MKRQPTTVRIARWSATNPWRAICLWIVFVAVASTSGLVVGSQKADIVDMGVGESGRAAEIVDEGKFDQPAEENILITARTGQLDRGKADAAAADVTERLRRLSEVSTVDPAVQSPDGKALLVGVKLSGDPKTATERVEKVLDETSAAQGKHPDLLIEQTGSASIGVGINDQVGKDIASAELISMPITLIILLIAFGALIAAGVPLLLALSAVGASIGLAALASHVFPAVDSASSVIMLMGMAVGVDYSLFYLKREREERAKDISHVSAVEIAAATSGHAVVVSGFAVIVSMAGLYLAGDAVFNSLATGSVIVVGVAMLGSLTVLPALLAKLGPRVDRPKVPLLWRLSSRPDRAPRLWPALLRPALRRPWLTLLLGVAAMLALAWPALDMKLRNSNIDDLPKDVAAVSAYHHLTESFPTKGHFHEIAVAADPARSADVRAALDRLALSTQDSPLFSHGGPAKIEVSPDGRVTTLAVPIPFAADDPKATESLSLLRGSLLPSTVGVVAGAEFAVGGDVARAVDYADHQAEKLPWVMGFVLLLTFLIMAATFRSLVVALTALILNMLSVASAFGVLALVFQNTWAEGLLDFTSNGAIVAWMPLFLFVVLFGLSMDYHVFVVSRIREAALRGLSTKDAVRDGITRSAGVVTSAALVMVCVFAAFAAASMMEMKQMGIGLSVAILLDALIIRALVLPSVMTLLGKANWWPSKMPPRRALGVPNDVTHQVGRPAPRVTDATVRLPVGRPQPIVGPPGAPR
ncbi:RND superfamily putative drug exporter [Herbihabitans rhizosphaerae]|uniref:RND superfamily putative drug exporter n=1 Tax=Herbihabitans rhizosphaerae TaxID=1872711 RepID=A0A4Q7KR00_9PSEU|nr:MMPL family transporter [Herbihabitans rhizosphaerae]RZS39288.1 RND superfamily putative drug exporter [Herbihabitans rhizosphaerae]